MNKQPELWGQRSQFACLINKEKDFTEELRLFHAIAPSFPTIQNLFDQPPIKFDWEKARQEVKKEAETLQTVQFEQLNLFEEN